MKKILLFLTFVLCAAASLAAFEQPIDLYNPARADHKLVATETFRGDKYGDFYGNPVAILDDGSGWKVHPRDAKQFLRWRLQDEVHVEIREQDYWLKREHHFYLVSNHTGEKVRAMLVKYPDNPLKVQDTNMADVYLWESQLCIYCYLSKKVLLNDGSEWFIYSKNMDYKIGRKVYLTYQNLHNGKKAFYFIVGIGRNVGFHPVYTRDQVTLSDNSDILP